VPVKSEAQQAVLTVHRARELLVTERTALVNQIRGLLLEYGMVIAQGIQRLRRTLPQVLAAAETLPTLVRDVVEELRERLLEWDRRITEYDWRIEQLATQNEAARRLRQVAGVEPMTATASVATIGEGHAFPHGRQFAAWLGVGPKQHSTGGKTMVGRITKHGNVYLRTLLMHGARAVVQFSAQRSDRKSRWVEAVRQRRGRHPVLLGTNIDPRGVQVDGGQRRRQTFPFALISLHDTRLGVKIAGAAGAGGRK
jgi:transposase